MKYKKDKRDKNSCYVRNIKNIEKCDENPDGKTPPGFFLLILYFFYKINKFY